MEEYKEKAWELYSQGETNITEISRQIKKTHGLSSDVEQIRKYLSKYINRRKKNQDHGPGIAQGCEQMGIDMSAVDHGWIKSKTHKLSFQGK